MKNRTIKNILFYSLSRLIFLGPIFFCLVACIDEFPLSGETTEDMICIDASLIKNINTQKVVITRSLSLDWDSIRYVTGCSVYVEDEDGDTRYFTEGKRGIYLSPIEDSWLIYQRKYRLHVETKEGGKYISDYEEILPCPPVDSIYSIEESSYSKTHGKLMPTLQFYLDIKANEEFSHYYMWFIEEDWKYQVPYFYYGFYDGNSVYWNIDPRTGMPIRVDTLRSCYKHGIVSGIYASSTTNLTINKKKKIPLVYHFSGDEKVSIKYSILVHQYSLAENAYAYWRQKQAEMQESDGMYFTQPAAVNSNISNVNNENERILGYFWAAATQVKRYVYNQSFGQKSYENCLPDTVLEIFDVRNWLSMTNDPFSNYIYFPIYFWVTGSPDNPGPILTSDEKCFDCRLMGGSLDPPEFWKEDNP